MNDTSMRMSHPKAEREAWANIDRCTRMMGRTSARAIARRLDELGIPHYLNTRLPEGPSWVTMKGESPAVYDLPPDIRPRFTRENEAI